MPHLLFERNDEIFQLIALRIRRAEALFIKRDRFLAKRQPPAPL